MNEGGTGRAVGVTHDGPVARMMRRVADRHYSGRPYQWRGESDLQPTAPADVEPDDAEPVEPGQSVSAAESEGTPRARRPLSTIRFEADSAGRKESGG